MLDIVNTALSPIGLNIQWPAQSTLNDGTVVISPLTVGIDNNTLGQQVIGANLNTVQPVRAALVNALLSASCHFADRPCWWATSASGSWRAAATSTSPSAAPRRRPTTSSPRRRSGPVPPTSLPSTSASSSTVTGNSGGGSVGGLGFTGNSGVSSVPPPVSSGTAGTPTSGGSQQVALGPVVKTSNCVSLGPAGGGCTTSNMAVPIGLGALALVVALFTWDYLRQRRRALLSGGTEISL